MINGRRTAVDRLMEIFNAISLFSPSEWTSIYRFRKISLLLRIVVIAALFLALLDVAVTQLAVLPRVEFTVIALITALTMVGWFLRRGKMLFTTILVGTGLVNFFALGNVVKFGPQLFSDYATHTLYLAPLCVANAIIFKPRPALLLNSLMLIELVVAACLATVTPEIFENSALMVRVVALVILQALFLAAVYLALDNFVRVRGQLTDAMRLLSTFERHDETNRESEQLRDHVTRFHRIATVEAMSTSLAHELNQPIGAALSFVQAAGRWLSQDPPALGEALLATGGACTQLERVLLVMNDIRKMSTLVPSESGWVDVGLHLRTMLDLLTGDYRNAGIQLNYAEPVLPGMRMAEVRIEEICQVVLNLVRNAIEAFEADGTHRQINVLLSRTEDGWLNISVSDSGPGIDSAMLEKVLDPFFTTKPHGSGLGLSICRSIAERHGGSLRIANRAEGGVIATFAFPVAHGAQVQPGKD